MRAALNQKGPFLAGSAILLGLIVSVLLAGWKGGLGMTLGIAATGLHVWLLWRMISILGEASRQQPVIKQGTALTVIGFVLQLPVFILLGFGAAKLGHAALYCFVAGLGMVYFGLVGWGISRT